jgi:hypothetical protein
MHILFHDEPCSRIDRSKRLRDGTRRIAPQPVTPNHNHELKRRSSGNAPAARAISRLAFIRRWR